jgi:WS/DGAT/MGAT family acyltransferase
MSEPLPKDRPLWQIRIAPRLKDGRIGVIGKAHHCMVDGLAAVELASLLLDPTPDAPYPDPERWQPEEEPHPVQALAGGVGDFLKRELSLAATGARIARSPERALRLAGKLPATARALGDAVRPARYVPDLNSPISPQRHLGQLARPLDDLQAIKRAFGVKLNDVILAASAGGVRRFLIRRGGSPCALKTMVPVSMRPADDADALGNRISFMFVDLPCDEPDPIRRLHAVHLATSRRKQAGDPEGAEAVIGSLGLAPPPLQRAVSRLAASPRAFNLVVSNIPGPGIPMYMRGCLLQEAYPVVPLADQHALSIGVTTIGDGAFFGLYADRESLPDADVLGAEIDAEIDQLADLGGARYSARSERGAIQTGG